MKEFVEKLIGRLKELRRDSIDEDCPIVPNSEDCEMEYSCASCYLNAVIKFVNELAEEYVTDTNVGKWIPCSERLPEYKGEYFITTNFDVTSALYLPQSKKWVDTIEQYFEYSCVAWQPLPDLYKPKENTSSKSSSFEEKPNFYSERFNRVI